jgi:syntaxin 16
MTYLPATALQGHAIKNKDLLVASGAVTLRGSEGMSDLYEDVQVAVRLVFILFPS